MTPKEKADYLVIDFYHILTDQEHCPVSMAYAKDCAVRCVDEILKNFGLSSNGQTFYTSASGREFYEQVIEELKTE